MDNAIEIDNLVYYYKNKRGVDNLCLTVPVGQIFGFLGPNGAGKTTVMKLMTGLLAPQSGDVRLFGHSVTSAYASAMADVGCIIENVDTFGYLTAYEHMRMVGRYADADESDIEACLDKVGMLRYKNEKSKGFSLGMKQRLGIAMAMVTRPKLLILDEPLNGLDVNGMHELRELILRMKEEDGVTFFISSHLIHDVERTCERVGVILDGRLFAMRDVSDILQDYASLENYYISEVGG